jgi:hypothetical protein
MFTNHPKGHHVFFEVPFLCNDSFDFTVSTLACPNNLGVWNGRRIRVTQTNDQRKQLNPQAYCSNTPPKYYDLRV